MCFYTWALSCRSHPYCKPTAKVKKKAFTIQSAIFVFHHILKKREKKMGKNLTNKRAEEKEKTNKRVIGFKNKSQHSFQDPWLRQWLKMEGVLGPSAIWTKHRPALMLPTNNLKMLPSKRTCSIKNACQARAATTTSCLREVVPIEDGRQLQPSVASDQLASLSVVLMSASKLQKQERYLVCLCLFS